MIIQKKMNEKILAKQKQEQQNKAAGNLTSKLNPDKKKADQSNGATISGEVTKKEPTK